MCHHSCHIIRTIFSTYSIRTFEPFLLQFTSYIITSTQPEWPFLSLLCVLLPWSQRFFLIEIKSKPRSGDNESWKRRGEREKPLVILASNLTFMQTTAVKRVKLLIKRVTNGNLANKCLLAAIFLSGGRPGEIMLWTNHLHLGGKEWFVNRGQAKACVNDGRQESRNKNTTL